MNIPFDAIAASLFALGLLLAVLAARGVLRFFRTGARSQIGWGSGLALAAAAMFVEGIVYVGFVDSPLLQAYVFLSAAIVGVLSLGATRVLKSPRIESIYSIYTLAACGTVALACAVTPLPDAMVTGGIIAGNPPLILLLLSSFVTVPATILLLSATFLSLQRSGRWPTILMAAGAITLGAGGTLYIASFPIALYYAEFLGILMLFGGLVSLPQTAPARAAAGTTPGTG